MCAYDYCLQLWVSADILRKSCSQKLLLGLLPISWSSSPRPGMPELEELERFEDEGMVALPRQDALIGRWLSLNLFRKG